MSRLFKYIILVTFLLAVTLIVFLQFNSNRSINELIDGNENLLQELTLKNDLQELQTQVVTLDNSLRETVIKDTIVDENHLKREISSLRQSLRKLDSMKTDAAVARLVVELQKLVNNRIDFNERVLQIFLQRGKSAAEDLLTAHQTKKLTDSIRMASLKIADLRQVTVTGLINDADDNGRKAKTLGSLIALIAAVASVFTFIYISHKVKQQQQFIEKLNESERRAKEAAQIKENFLANMSHEIRTPLNAIIGYTNLLQRHELDEQSAGFVGTIHQAGNNLLSIINDILDLSKIEAGMMRIESAPFSLRGLIDSVEMMFQSRLDEKEIEFIIDVEDSLPDTLEGDAVRLTQVLINLVGNAVKFTNNGFVALRLTNEGIIDGTVQTGIEVQDTGIGIDRQNLNSIFERFQQAETSVTRKYGGSGLGLSIVKDLVELQKGSVSVESEPGVGTTFHVSIPYRIISELLTPVAVIEHAAGNITDLSTVNILVAEDNEINQNLIRHLFEHWKVNFDIVGNGREAIQFLTANRYDLVLMDIQMPEVDGYSATRKIRRDLKLNIPIIAMTAHALAGERDKCLSQGMNEYISKPLQEERLFRLISQFVKLRKEVPVYAHVGGDVSNGYSLIDLQYMKEVSMGNMEYEKAVTEQFVEAVPEDLRKLEWAWNARDIALLRQTAHNMKTTISVMGLNDRIDPYLHILEYEELSEERFRECFGFLSSVLDRSITEALTFYNSL